MKLFLYYVALVLAGLAMLLAGLWTRYREGTWYGGGAFGFLAGSFFFYLLSMAPFIHD
jgi:hypothetical protein